MIPAFNFRPLLIQYEEDEDSSSLDESESWTDSSSEDDLALPVSSTSSAGAVDLTSRMSSTALVLPICRGRSTLTIPEMVPAEMTPVHPVPTMNPMSSIPSTSRRIEHDSDDFRFEAARRLSFRYWPATFMDTAALAAAGFYYTGKYDRIKCFECRLMISRLWRGCDPMKIHKECSPECTFIRDNKKCDNVPLGTDPDPVIQTTRRTGNTPCPYGLQYPELFLSDSEPTRLTRYPTEKELSRLGLKIVEKPKNLNYASYQSRLNSLETWPTDMTPRSKELVADAGFYYTGRDDITTCYHCGISRGNWSSGVDPWRDHAILSPRCCYLLTVRGGEYINNVTGHEYYETSAEAPTQDTVESDERPNSKNEIDEVTLAEKVDILEQENQSLKDARSCKVCTQREATITYLPCGHLATCSYCAPAFRQCFICNTQIKATARTFLS